MQLCAAPTEGGRRKETGKARAKQGAQHVHPPIGSASRPGKGDTGTRLVKAGLGAAAFQSTAGAWQAFSASAGKERRRGPDGTWPSPLVRRRGERIWIPFLVPSSTRNEAKPMMGASNRARDPARVFTVRRYKKVREKAGGWKGSSLLMPCAP